jgi:hypothetical protein
MANLPSQPITLQQAWQMLSAAINDPAYSLDPETEIDGLGRWIKGVRLNSYRDEHNPPYPPSPNKGMDWFKCSEIFREERRILKYSQPNRFVFFVLPDHQNAFEHEYTEATLVEG